MKTNYYYLKLLLATLILPLLYFLYDLILKSPTTSNSMDILWGFVSNILVVITLGFYVSYSTLRRFKLALAVFLIYYIIGHFNILIEAYIFNVTGRVETSKKMLQGLIIVSLFSLIFVYIFDKWDGQSKSLKFQHRVAFSWVWRVFLGTFLYLIFYFTAGLILQAVYPALMDFYIDKIPPFDLMIFTQFPRGFLFVMIAIFIMRTTNLPLIKKALLVGLVFSILGAIAPLIPPNEFMPGNIRFVHGFEVGISNFLYGLFLGYLFGQKTQNEKLTAANTI